MLAGYASGEHENSATGPRHALDLASDAAERNGERPCDCRRPPPGR